MRLVGRLPPSCPSSPAHALAPTPTPEYFVGAVPLPALAHALGAQASVGPDAQQSDQQLVTSAKANPLASLDSLAHRLAAQLSLTDGDAGADSLASSNGLFDLLNVCYVL